ncbi:hypothetical protein ABB07_07705 [Streptomyces incarnatus]|uniref:Uncharacterized protein n=1 Tax=Streptomyces incarnatus TaxID=665007 RepID=A0ABM5TG66_9ACTN|nr:hypothetical protein ABB07_07705 [Streptomyces incarnatus]
MHVSHPRARRSSLLLTAYAALAVTGALLTPPSARADAAPAAAEVSPHAAQTIDNIGASGAWWVNDLQHFAPEVQSVRRSPGQTVTVALP